MEVPAQAAHAAARTLEAATVTATVIVATIRVVMQMSPLLSVQSSEAAVSFSASTCSLSTARNVDERLQRRHARRTRLATLIRIVTFPASPS